MSVEKLDNTLRELWNLIEEMDDDAARDGLALQVDRVVDPILRAAKGQRGSMTFPQQSQPTSQQPGISGGSSQPTLMPQPTVTQTTGTVECPKCNKILNIDVTLS